MFRNVNVTLLSRIRPQSCMLHLLKSEGFIRGAGEGGGLGPLFLNFLDPPLAVAVRMRKFRPLPEPIRLQDLLNSARSRAEKKINITINPQGSKSRFFVLIINKKDPCCVDDKFKGYADAPIVLVNTLEKFLKECLESVESHLNPVQYFIP